MTKEAIRQKLDILHEHEDIMNKQMTLIDREIYLFKKRKQKLARQISKNMRYRNELIKRLGDGEF